MNRLVISALTAALALGGGSGAVAAVPANDAPDAASSLPMLPSITTTDLGSAKLYAQADPHAYLGGVAFYLGGGSDRQPATQSGVAALLAEVVERTAVDGVSVRAAIAAAGGSSTFEVSGPYVRFYVEGRGEKLADLVRILGRALAAPDYTQANVDAARESIIARIADEQRNPVGVGLQMVLQSYYAGSAGLPPLGSPASLVAIGPDQLRMFHDATYKGGSTVVTAVGQIIPQATTAARELVAALPAGAAAPLDVKTIPLQKNPKRIVTHRDIGVPFIVVGFAAPSPGDRDYGPFLVLRQLVESIFSPTTATTPSPLERPVGTIYVGDERSSSFSIYINGAETEPTLKLRELQVVLSALATRPIPASGVALYKQSARGAYLTNSESLSDRAGQLGGYVEHGLDPNYQAAALDSLDHTTAADVERVAKAYLQRFTVAIVFPRESVSDGM